MLGHLHRNVDRGTRRARLEVVPAIDGEDPTGELRIGRDVRVEDFAHFGAADRIEIGDLCLIASFVYITDHDHGMGPQRSQVSRSSFAPSRSVDACGSGTERSC
jgi:acetyltransferase-like isoleucine patch superfamily enzyme